MLFNLADCIIIAPGGVGTLDEMWDCICCKKLDMNGLEHKPLCLLNYDGFFDGSVIQLHKANDENMLYGEPDSYFHAVQTIEDAISYSLKEVQKIKSTTMQTSKAKEKDKSTFRDSIMLENKRDHNNNDYSIKNTLHYSILLSVGFTFGIITMAIFHKTRNFL